MGVRRSSGALVASLVSLLGLSGCTSGCRSAYVTLPDEGGAFLFSPGGRSALLARPRRLVLYDVDARRIVWERVLDGERDPTTTFSPSGRYLAVFSRDLQKKSRLVLLQASDGREVLSHEASGEHSELMAPSDDGEWVAWSPSGDVVVIEDRAGQVVHQQKVAALVGGIAFEKDTARLAITTANSISIVERDAGSFVLRATFTDVHWGSFAGGALFFQSARGVERWDGTERKTIFATRDHLPASNEAGGAKWLVSPDGRYVALWNRSTLMLADASTGAVTYQQEGRSSSDDYVCAAAFDATLLRAFLCSGELEDVDLAQGKVVKSRAFGEVGSATPNYLQEGTSWSVAYHWALAPGGRYFLVSRAGKHEIYLLE